MLRKCDVLSGSVNEPLQDDKFKDNIHLFSFLLYELKKRIEQEDVAVFLSWIFSDSPGGGYFLIFPK